MREELKYVVPEAVIDRLRRDISPFMELDRYGVGYEARGYTVRSIYLDSPQLLYYYEKQAHLQNRKKLRIRAYNRLLETSGAFLEIKRKFSSAIAKDRAPVAYRDVAELFLTADVGRFVDPTHSFPEAREAARSFFYHVYQNNLRPTSLVVYEREAFVGSFDPTLRITLDRDLRGKLYPDLPQLFDDHDLEPVMTGSFILEVKYNTRFPGWLRPILAQHGLMQRAASKYCMVIDQFERRREGKVAVLANMPAIITNGRNHSEASPETHSASERLRHADTWARTG